MRHDNCSAPECRSFLTRLAGATALTAVGAGGDRGYSRGPTQSGALERKYGAGCDAASPSRSTSSCRLTIGLATYLAVLEGM
jgi:hypothetical protein